MFLSPGVIRHQDWAGGQVPSLGSNLPMPREVLEPRWGGLAAGPAFQLRQLAQPAMLLRLQADAASRTPSEPPTAGGRGLSQSATGAAGWAVGMTQGAGADRVIDRQLQPQLVLVQHVGLRPSCSPTAARWGCSELAAAAASMGLLRGLLPPGARGGAWRQQLRPPTCCCSM